MPETIVFSAFQTTVLLNMLQKKREEGDVGQKPIKTFIEEVLSITSKFN
jgi:hypothetical protein